MNNTDYLQKILSLCTTEQQELITWMYPNKLSKSQVDRVIRQVKNILKIL